MLHAKFISNLLEKIWVVLAPVLCASKITVTLPLLALPLPPLNFLLTILFKIHGLSYLFFRSDNYNSPEFGKKKLQKFDCATLCSNHVRIKINTQQTHEEHVMSNYAFTVKQDAITTVIKCTLSIYSD